MIRIGMIGVGGISGAHLNYLKTRKDVEIAALCDVRPENLDRRCKEFGGAAFSDFDEMLRKVAPDAVYICTPPQVRREPILACARKGIPVFCEKPVGRDAAYAARVAREAAALKARIQIGYVFRAMPVIQRLREAMADDAITAVQSFYGCNMSVTRGAAAWFYDKAISGGALVDQATHNLDLLRNLFGEVKEVCGMAGNPAQKKVPGYTVDEVIGVNLRFGSGLIAAHLHTWLGDGWRNEIIISGRKRLYRLNLGKGALTVESGGETAIFQQDGASIYNYENGRFLDMVARGDWSANPCDFSDALATLRLTLACDRAVSE